MSLLEDIDAPGGAVRLSTSSAGDDRVVDQEPAKLLAQARSKVGSISLDEYTLARIIASEHGSGRPLELLAIGDADLNRSSDAGLSIFEHATASRATEPTAGRFGGQGTSSSHGRKRPVATSRDPSVRHLRAARALLDGRARGVALGARRYFDPHSQLSGWAAGKPTYCHPLVILERWTYDLPFAGRAVDGDGRVDCRLGSTRGRSQEEWVGHILGIDPWELILMRPATALQDGHYAAAKVLIETKGETIPLEGRPPQLRGSGILEAALAALAIKVVLT